MCPFYTTTPGQCLAGSLGRLQSRSARIKLKSRISPSPISRLSFSNMTHPSAKHFPSAFRVYIGCGGWLSKLKNKPNTHSEAVG